MVTALTWIHVVAVALGGFFSWFLGGIDGLIYVLIAFVAVDYVTGVMRSITEKKLCSQVGANGIFMKITVFLLVGAANMIDIYLIRSDGNMLKNAVVFFYISNEGISVLENAAAIGLPIPNKLKDTLVTLRNKNL